jgi:hypothetical protein
MTLPTATRIFESPADAAYFFGYFNTPQVSADSTRILALRVARFDRVPEPDEVAEVGWFEIGADTPAFHKIGETTAFNWQQGAMFQFLGPDFNRRVIWNHFDGTAYRARIHDLETGQGRDVPAIYNVFPDGTAATTVDFERHAWFRRGYSYGNVIKPEKNMPVVPEDAIWRVDLETGARTPLITLGEMMALSPHGTMQGATHYLEHSTANPSGSHFVFLHRWRHDNGIHSRLLVARADGSDIRILNDSGRMSHFCWVSGTRLLGYGGKANPVNTLRRNKALLKAVFSPLLPLYKRLVSDTSALAKSLTGDAYYMFDIETPGKLQLAVPSMRAGDGHPTMLPDGRHFITDTYARAEKKGERPKLFVVDLETDTHAVLDELGSIDRYDETPQRCDLHPRVSPAGDIVSIDTMDGGQRRTYAYRLEQN